MENLEKLLSLLKTFPKWFRIVFLILLSAIIVCLSLISCGPTVKVAAKSTTDMVSISVSQSVTDSTGVSVHVNPNININPIPK